MAAVAEDRNKQEGQGFAGLAMLVSDVDTLLAPAPAPTRRYSGWPVATSGSITLWRAMTALGSRTTGRTGRATALHRTPFALLGVTPRDDRRRIVELAEEKSLERDHDSCQKAQADLTTPRNRLRAEMAWLPGVAPQAADRLMQSLCQNPVALRQEAGLPTLAHLNLLAAAFESVSGDHDADGLADFIQEFAYLAAELDAAQVLKEINADRAVAGFPEVRALEQIGFELAERKRYYRNAIKDALDRLPSNTLVRVITATVEEATAGGTGHGPELIDELVESYEAEIQGFLQKATENVHKLIKAARHAAHAGDAAVQPYVDQLQTVARNWDTVARPIQLSAKARGMEHAASSELGYGLRSLALELFNTHNLLTESSRLMDMLRDVFAELPQLSERVEQDAMALADIADKRKQAMMRKDEWVRAITYRVDIGFVFKKTLSISPEGVSWRGQRFALDSITRVRWGGVRRSVNGGSASTTYAIAFGDRHAEAVIELKNQRLYTTIVDTLWLAVCVRLLGEMLEALKSGRDLYFGPALVHDDGITLVRHKFLGSKENVRCAWEQVRVWSAAGAFYIGAKADQKVHVGISYLHVANTHILEQTLRIAFKRPGLRRLSDMLQ